MRFYHELLGVEITIPDEPRRVVSLAPDLTEIMFRLGRGDRLVGISLYCLRPRGKLEGLPRVGAYLKVHEARLAALRPDVVLTTLGAQRETARSLLAKGYAVVALPVPMSLWGILDNLHRLAVLMGAEDRGRAVIFRLVQRLMSLRGRFSGIRVYWEVDLGGPVSAGRMSYVTDALGWLGLTNIYADRPVGYFTPSDEETRSLAPELVLYEPRKTRKQDKRHWIRMLHDRLKLDVPVVVLPHDSLAHYGPALVDEVLPRVTNEVARAGRP